MHTAAVTVTFLSQPFFHCKLCKYLQGLPSSELVSGFKPVSLITLTYHFVINNPFKEGALQDRAGVQILSGVTDKVNIYTTLSYLNVWATTHSPRRGSPGQT